MEGISTKSIEVVQKNAIGKADDYILKLNEFCSHNNLSTEEKVQVIMALKEGVDNLMKRNMLLGVSL
tara:strand:+ start:230 stop:430 length:201 start_codon:yes stop_codon:yes gene_type:complete